MSMGFVHHLPYPSSTIGTLITIVLALLIYAASQPWANHGESHRERYRRRKFLVTSISIVAALVIIVVWARQMEHTSTFLGLIGAGIAVGLREPLLSIAGRFAIMAGNIYSVGDRIEINQMKGDVIDIGFFYTRLMEIGNWIGGDQFSGRIVQFSNSQIFGTPVFNYTGHFAYIWDEVKLPITYQSNIKAARDILLEAGSQYTRQFLEGAQAQLKKMQRYFLVADFELEPAVYLKVTSNWIELTMRYVVEPKNRRVASNFIYTQAFGRLKTRRDIVVASETMDVTYFSGADKQKPEEERAA